MQEDRVPKVFISYSWSSDEMVTALAERLVSHGVDVVFDKWDLKEGQDKYAFMERSVNDPSITKVLIVCDKKYADKANARTGGVGDETVIISSEVYGRVEQEKFIPVIAEHDPEGNAYVPAYIKSRIYIDLSNEENYEAEYEKLLRNIYNKPLYRKPALGTMPDWLDEESRNFFPLTDLIRQIKGAQSEKKQESCVRSFIEKYIEELKPYIDQGSGDGEKVYKCFVEMKSIRDIFLDFLEGLKETEMDFADVIGEAFEQMYNTLTNAKGFNPNAHCASDTDYEIYKIFLWELFICVIAFLRHEQNYKAINMLLTRTYFLTFSCLDNRVKPANYCHFRHYSAMIEDVYKPKTDKRQRITLLGDTIYTQREKRPIYTKEAIAEADLFLYQVRNAYKLVEDEERLFRDYWFPELYIYVENSPIEWTKMKSLKYCDKMLDLFGVNNVKELRDALKNCTFDSRMRHPKSFDAAPAILSYIKLEEIGSLN